MIEMVGMIFQFIGALLIVYFTIYAVVMLFAVTAAAIIGAFAAVGATLAVFWGWIFKGFTR